MTTMEQCFNEKENFSSFIDGILLYWEKNMDHNTEGKTEKVYKTTRERRRNDDIEQNFKNG